MSEEPSSALSSTGALILVGGGKMGGALLSGWLDGGVKPDQLTVVEPDPTAGERLAGTGVQVVASGSELPPDLQPTVVVLAVKPQVKHLVLPDYRRFVAPDCVFLSIAAGKTLAFFAEHLGAEAAVVRSMPNTPAAVGRGMSVLIANARVSAAQRDLCQALLQAVGETHWLDDEGHLDAVTGLSGSGPAYVFHLVEALAAAGRSAGLSEDVAQHLARQTVVGAGELLHQAPESASQLRQNVTSPKGTTEAALEILMAENGLTALMTEAVAAAARRSRELAT